MSKLKIEAFLSKSNDSNNDCLSKLIENIIQEFGDNVEILTYQGENDIFNEYCLTITPALVIEEMIKFMGFCPSKDTVISALRESGLE